MNDMKLLRNHIGTIDDAIDLANEFYWSLTVSQSEGQWIVRTGDKVALMTDSRAVVDAFLYGLGLAYSVMPDELTDRFREIYHMEEVDD